MEKLYSKNKTTKLNHNHVLIFGHSICYSLYLSSSFYLFLRACVCVCVFACHLNYILMVPSWTVFVFLFVVIFILFSPFLSLPFPVFHSINNLQFMQIIILRIDFFNVYVLLLLFFWENKTEHTEKSHPFWTMCVIKECIHIRPTT